MMDADKYLERIGYSASLSLTENLLSELQQCHFFTVPYENFDILLKKPLKLDNASLYEKVVEENRGGYCFELNGLNGWLLRSLGFKVTDHMARFLLDEPEIPMRRHRVLKVELNGCFYLCDVGVGIEVPRRAILLEPDAVQEQNGARYKIDNDSFLGTVLLEEHMGEWRMLYSFTDEPQLPIDYIMPSFYCECHPDSIFNKAPMVALKTSDGRRTLDGRTFKTFTKGGVDIYEAENLQAFSQRLRDYFGIAIELPKDFLW